MDAKPVSESRIITRHLSLPAEANAAGNMYGGHIMRHLDSVGFFSAAKHAACKLVTASATTFFREPIKIGEILVFHASVNAVWNTSLEVGVRAEAECPYTGQRRHVCSCYLIYVGVDDEGAPSPLPPLVAETDEDRRRRTDAERRMQFSRQEKRHNAP